MLDNVSSCMWPKLVSFFLHWFLLFKQRFIFFRNYFVCIIYLWFNVFVYHIRKFSVYVLYYVGCFEYVCIFQHTCISIVYLCAIKILEKCNINVYIYICICVFMMHYIAQFQNEFSQAWAVMPIRVQPSMYYKTFSSVYEMILSLIMSYIVELILNPL